MDKSEEDARVKPLLSRINHQLQQHGKFAAYQSADEKCARITATSDQ